MGDFIPTVAETHHSQRRSLNLGTACYGHTMGAQRAAIGAITLYAHSPALTSVRSWWVTPCEPIDQGSIAIRGCVLARYFLPAGRGVLHFRKNA